jgi:hypothetical protein
MPVIYTSKEMSKKFGVRVVYRKIRYFVKGLNNFKIYYAARDMESGILTAQSAGLLNVESWPVHEIEKRLADM